MHAFAPCPPLPRSRVWAMVLGMVLGLAGPAMAAAPAPWTGKVVRVISGSILEIRHGDRSENYHLAGVAAPNPDQPWGDRAKQFAEEGAKAQVVTVEPQGPDYKKRSMVTVILPDGRDLGAELIKEGLAWHHRRTAKNPMLADLEKDARTDRRGLWGDPNPIPPWEWTGQRPVEEPAEEEPPPSKKKKKRR